MLAAVTLATIRPIRSVLVADNTSTSNWSAFFCVAVSAETATPADGSTVLAIVAPSLISSVDACIDAGSASETSASEIEPVACE